MERTERLVPKVKKENKVSKEKREIQANRVR